MDDEKPKKKNKQIKYILLLIIIITLDLWIYSSLSKPKDCAVPNKDFSYSIPSNENVICFIPKTKLYNWCYYNKNESFLNLMQLSPSVKCSSILAPNPYNNTESISKKNNLTTNTLLP